MCRCSLAPPSPEDPISLKLGSLAESVARLPMTPEVSRRQQAAIDKSNPVTMNDASEDASWRA